jgi:hypothetical protein
MKKILFFFSFIIFAQNGQAQIFNIGLKAGINLQNIEVSDFDAARSTYDEIENGEQKSGFHAGVYTQINTPIFHIRPEFIYTYINNSITAKSVSGFEDIFNIQFNRFDVPLLIGKSLGPLRINAGPVMSFIISEPSDAFKQGINEATWGYQAGVGLDVGKIALDIRYEGAFSSMIDSITIDGQTFNLDARGRQLIISLGIKLF